MKTLKPVKTALVGAGHLGTYHAEKLFRNPLAELTVVCDHSKEKARKLAEKYSCKAISDYKQIPEKVSAVVISTPTSFHFEIAKFFLESGKHLLVEKPISQTAEEAKQLFELAKNRNLILQVGHVERFNPAYVKFKELLEEKVLFIKTLRLAPFQPRNTDVGVVLDLMVHDIDLVLSLEKTPLKFVSALGASVVTSHTDFAHVYLQFESGLTASLTASRISEGAVREWDVFQKTGLFFHINFNSFQVNQFKTGDSLRMEMESEERKSTTLESDDKSRMLKNENKNSRLWTLEQKDALFDQDKAFIDSVLSSQAPIVGGSECLKVMKVVEQIHEQIL